MDTKLKISEKDINILKEKFPKSEAFEAALNRLKNREPLAYIIGEWYFYDEIYKVSPHCLIPRPETELIVEELIKRLPPNGVFADLCTGSGCIAISVLAHRKDCSAIAVDISNEALNIAKQNASLNGVSDRIKFLSGNLLIENPLGSQLFDIIVSNPPYISSEVIDTLEPEVLCEPRIALDGGNDGLIFYKRFTTEFVNNIKPNGFLICEIGYDQAAPLKKLCNCEIKKDYSNNDRILILQV